MSKEVMQQALEALKVVYPSMLDGEDVCKQRSDAIAALKGAIKQASEPVAYRITTPDGITWIGAHPSILPKHTSEPLYTAAPSMQAEQAPCNIPEGWQPIETAPRDPQDETEILAWGDHLGFMVVYWEHKPIAAPDDFNWATTDGLNYHKDAFTRWMPLPAAPSE